MLRKLIAIALAIVINVGVLSWLNHMDTSMVANATPRPTPTGKVVTLPVITVRPTPAQIRTLRAEGAWPAPATTAAAGGTDMQTLVMPYYSFGRTAGGVRRG